MIRLAFRSRLSRCRCNLPLVCGALLAALSCSSPAAAENRDLEVQQADGSTWTIHVRPQPALAQRPAEPPAEPDASGDEDDDDAAAAGPEAPPQETDAGAGEDGWNIEIIPAVSAENPGVRYSRLYRSIPYNRAEFLANPMYRHQAAVELLLGEPRPMNVYQTAARPVPPVHSALVRWVFPYGVAPAAHAVPHGLPRAALPYDLSRGPYSIYQHLFGYSGGYRLKYYLGGGFGR